MAKNDVHILFDDFLQKSILGNDSCLTDNTGIFTIDNLNECVSAFVDKPDTSKRNFDEKSKDQFSGTTKDVQEVFAHFIWLWSMPATDMTAPGKSAAITRFIGDDYKSKLKPVFVDGGTGSAGQWHKLNKPFEISYLLLLFREVKKNLEAREIKDIEALKKYLEQLCNELDSNNQETTITTDDKLKIISKGTLALYHILLHLCAPEKYEAIAALKHKKAIVDTFYRLIDDGKTEGLSKDINENILAIRIKLEEILGEKISFYDKKIQDAWNFGESKNDASEVTQFEYKKALVFYGPPGTSKTHSATRLAELLISKQYFRDRSDFKEYFANSKTIFENHIHHLQLHSNYHYEDFIAGMHIEKGESVVKRGYLLNLIEKIKGDKLPHILILDEINRTDIARLFGELFSALEYRTKKIKLSVGDLEIELPENLYFIGTMNEIDFSLERIDFALYRRFLWQFKGFDRDILHSMIREKKSDLKIKDEDIETFIDRCETLNEYVSKTPELGENYQVGHTFFAEVVDIYKSMQGIHSGSLNFLKHPVNVLWEISIKPILMAFLGNMDADTKKEKINAFHKLWIGG
jgi:5-methylcytosine-specific restriction protein B